jgi:hypothetical protein
LVLGRHAEGGTSYDPSDLGCIQEFPMFRYIIGGVGFAVGGVIGLVVGGPAGAAVGASVGTAAGKVAGDCVDAKCGTENPFDSE